MPDPAPDQIELPVRRIQRVSDQVAEQLRNLIMAGELPPGARLPSAQALSTRFGVSRAGVREALQALATEGLTRTKKGVHGGVFVTTPTADHVGSALRSGVTLLSRANDITLAELLEVRELIEVPATQLAAQRRTQDDLRQLVAAVPSQPDQLTIADQFVQNRGFHEAIMRSSRNTLLSICARPVYILQSRIARASLGPEFHQTINEQHREIFEAIASADAEAAATRMRDHLHWLAPYHERAWWPAEPTAVDS
jgi:GntR family transcriptional repressor for pyruvate dehydrogenase complex